MFGKLLKFIGKFQQISAYILGIFLFTSLKGNHEITISDNNIFISWIAYIYIVILLIKLEENEPYIRQFG